LTPEGVSVAMNCAPVMARHRKLAGRHRFRLRHLESVLDVVVPGHKSNELETFIRIDTEQRGKYHLDFDNCSCDSAHFSIST
jgi:hypothetical protein